MVRCCHCRCDGGIGAERSLLLLRGALVESSDALYNLCEPLEQLPGRPIILRPGHINLPLLQLIPGLRPMCGIFWNKALLMFLGLDAGVLITY